jgi:oligopeptide transport system substrate-binding protein
MNLLSWKRTYTLLLLLALVLPILAACGGSGGGTTASPSPAASTAASPAASPSQAPAASPSESPAASPSESPAASPSGSPSGSTGGNVLRVGLYTWPDTLDPQKASFSQEIATLGLMYEGLTGLDKELKTVPAAAEKWEYNENATAVTFTLRSGLKYSDGSPLTADDFVKAIHRTLDPNLPGDYQTSISMIEGAEDIIATEVPTGTDTLASKYEALGVQAVDERTLVFTLTQPTPYFHTLMSLWVTYPAKDELVKQGGQQWYEDAANHVGNGPFKVTNIDRGNNLIEYEPNENYWQGRPKLDGVQLRFINDLAVALQAYKNGEIDMVEPDPNDAPTLRSDPELSKEFKEYPGSCTFVLAFNLTKAPFDNKQVREAFAYAFDRETLVRDALQETEVPTLTWIPSGYPGHKEGETRYGFDVEKAKATLAEAGFPEGQGFPEVKVSYNSNNPATQARVEYIIQMLQSNLGVTLVPDPVEGTTLTNLRKDVSTYPQMLYRGGWCADYPDPQNWLSVYWHSRSNFAKNIGYKNAQLDELLDQADVETDEQKRFDLYAQAQDLVLQDQPQVMLSNNKNTYLVKPYVQGVDFTPQDSTFPGQETGLFNVTIQK